MINERAVIKASKTSCMSDAKWQKLFDFLRERAGTEQAKVKTLFSDGLYEILLYVQDDHTPDFIAGPVKLSEIEILYVRLDKGEQICRELERLGKFEYELDENLLKIYGYAG